MCTLDLPIRAVLAGRVFREVERVSMLRGERREWKAWHHMLEGVAS